MSENEKEADEFGISLCTVGIQSLKPYMDLMIKSAIKRLPSLREVVITDVDVSKNYSNEWKQDGITFKRLGYSILHQHVALVNHYVAAFIREKSHLLRTEDVDEHLKEAASRISFAFGHALGLHNCLANVKREYVLFCDPDVIFLNKVDEIYFEFMQKYNLDYIGCAHESANKVAYGHFPYLANSLVKREKLPDGQFLTDDLYFHDNMRYYGRPIPTDPSLSANEKWLIRGVIPKYVDKFPHPDLKTSQVGAVDFDTSSNLYLWALQNNWRWLSFLTPDCHYYKTAFYRSNIDLKEKLKVQPLIYHQFGRYRNFEEFEKVYTESQEIEN